MTEPRTLKRLLLAALALLLAWQAQSRLSGPLISDGAILYGIAIVLFVAAFARLPAAQLARGQLGDTSQTQTTLPYPQVMLLTLAMLCSLVSFILFTNPANQPTAWLFHIASILVFLSAFLSFNVQAFKRSNVQTLQRCRPSR